MTTKLCPLLKKACVEHQCAWYTHVIGQDPQTGAAVDEWQCAVVWIPILAIEGSRSTRSVASAVESMRNEVVQRQDALQATVQGQVTERIGVNREEVPAVSYDADASGGVCG